MTILDPCMSLERIKKNGCVGSCGYAPASVNISLQLVAAINEGQYLEYWDV